METEEALFAAVGEELQSGQIRQGLWAKALAEEGYDEQRAKARYLKLRVRALRKEIADAEYQDQVRAREEQKRQRSQAIESGFQNLGWRVSGLAQRKRARTRLRAFGFWFPFVVGTAVSFPYVKDENTGLLGQFFIAAGVGLFAGVVGFLVEEITRWFMPTQRHLNREEAAIQAEHEKLDRAKMSWLERTATDLWNLALGLALLCYLVYLGIKYFAK